MSRRMRASSMDAVFAGGGAMGAMMRAFDWSKTAVGPVENWPQSLRTAVSILLDSGYPMYIAWGPEFVQFYNDAYRPILGSTKHPAALGQPSPECFPEIWDTIGPMFRRVRDDGEATTFADFLLPLDRNGFPEECYFDFSYSAARDESGGVGGVFVTCSETTGRVIGQRRLATLRELAAAMAGARTPADACERAARVLAANERDLPFTFIYLVDQVDGEATLVGASGLEVGHPGHVLRVPLDAAGSGWPLAEVAAAGAPAMIDDLGRRFGGADASAWPQGAARAVAVPMTVPGGSGDGEVIGVVAAGISPHLLLDDDYRGFLDLIAGQIATAVTNVRAYQEALARAEALAELDRAKTDFFSNVSHEFRTPITLSLGPLADVLADDVRQPGRLGERDRERIEIAHRNSLRLLKLVNSLLDFSRLQAGTANAVFQPIDLGSFTREISGAFRSAIDAAGLGFEVDCDPLPQPVYVDPDLWEKLVLNLLSNAFKFTLKGSIRVRLTAGEGSAILSVSDTGVGIPPAQLDHVFERFHRVRGAQSRSYEGTGIGLALVQQAVELHGGRVTVASSLGEATTFTVEIPFGHAHLPDDQLQQPGSDAPPVAGPRLTSAGFVLEANRWSGQPTEAIPDIPSELGTPTRSASTPPRPRSECSSSTTTPTCVRRLLGRHWQVETAGDGREALEKIAATPVDLVVSDVMMPRMDGFELIRALRTRRETAALPVIVLSARAGQEATVEGLDAGADDYLVKPFAASELLARVRNSFQLAALRAIVTQGAARYQAAEVAQRHALEVLIEIAQHVDSNAGLEGFFADLTRTVARLVQSRVAAFWLLDPERETLSLQRGAVGFDAALLEAMPDVPCLRDGEDVADLVVYRDLVLGPSNLGDPQFAVYREWLAAMGVRDGIAASWRAGDTPLGLVAAYDSTKPDGFDAVDTWVLRAAGLAAGLVWQHRQAERALDELRLAEGAQLRDQVTRMTEMEEVKSQFLRLASHELRGPLGLLRGYMDMITSGSLGESAPGVLRIYPILTAKVEEMGRLVEQMLETARLEDARLHVASDTFDLRVPVAAAVDSLLPLATAAHRIDLNLSEEEVLVVGDEVRVRTIVTNLLENAIKYSIAGGAIEVACRAEAGETALAVVEVADAGIGIDEEDMDRVFTRFGRVVNDDNSHISGTGLGLYLSREFARRQGGDITLASTRGVGTRARFVIPTAPD